jgi:Telomere resolvase
MARQWLSEEIHDIYIPYIRGLKPTAKGKQALIGFVAKTRESWGRDRKLSTLKQQQGLMDETRKELKEAFGVDHWSLDIFTFARDEWYEINSGKGESARTRQLNQGYIDPDAVVAVAVRLLDSALWADVAAGIAVLTGRRLNEILKTAEFEITGQWTVQFTGALKRKDDPLVFEIPTLTTAKKVVTALEKLRKITPEGAREVMVSQASEKHFSEIVPVHDSNGLYAHLWRSVYATIATFWYCPKNVDDLLFKAHIMGHFEALSEAERQNPNALSKRLESFASERHYRLYEIADKVIAQHAGQRKGIKLGHGGVIPLEAFQQVEIAQGRAKRGESRLRVYKDSQERWNTVFEAISTKAGMTQIEKTETLLEWVEARLKAEEVLPVEQAVVEASTSKSDVQELIAFLARDPLRDDIKTLVMALANVVSTGMVTVTPPKPEPKPESQSSAQHPDLEQEAEPTQEPKNPRKKRESSEAIQIVHSYIDAIMAHNNEPDRVHEEKWWIGIAVLKKLGCSQPRIIEVLSERADEIKTHHEMHQLGENHNFYHRQKRQITDIIKL